MNKLTSATIGGWLQSASPIMAEAMAISGFDWIAIDMEHGPVTETEVTALFLAIERHDVIPLVRLPSADPFLARRLLDLGAQGFIIPVVEDPVTFTEFANHCLYPPAGRRGLGLYRANKWGDQFEDYFRNFYPILVPQIETKKGADAAAEIAALEFVYGLFIGPYDLSADLGKPGNFNTSDYNACRAAIRDACIANDKAPGIHQVEPDIESLKARQKEGFRFIAFGTDIIAVRHTFEGLAELF